MVDDDQPFARPTIARARSQTGIPEAYADWARQEFSAAPQQDAEVTARDVAEAVWQR